MKCSNGHEMQETARSTLLETVEEVVYIKQRIKHFNREGSEFWTEIDVPDIVERSATFETVEFQCPTCGELHSLRNELPVD
jgi:hypothetical protein